jgi:hypothetical protein
MRGMLRGKNAMKGEMERKTVYEDENFIENREIRENVSFKITGSDLNRLF